MVFVGPTQIHIDNLCNSLGLPGRWANIKHRDPIPDSGFFGTANAFRPQKCHAHKRLHTGFTGLCYKKLLNFLGVFLSFAI